MAQWLGQYSGQTHATRVADAAAALRHAVEVLRSARPGVDRASQSKAIDRLARRLLAARLKSFGARLAAAEDVQSGVALARRAEEIAALKRKEAAIRAGGLDAIRAEFRANDPPVA